MRLKRVVVLISASILAASALAVAAQSLGDIAKKEEERRKKVPQPGKVYTNKDLGSPTSETPPPPATAPASDAKPADKKDAKDAAADKDKDKDKDKESPKDQKYWADRKKSLQDQLDRDQTYADALQSRINALTTDFVNRADPAQRAVIERDRQKALGELNRLKNQIVADKKALVDLDEEARRAGVPPGWLR